jgi:hypothetical protein
MGRQLNPDGAAVELPLNGLRLPPKFLENYWYGR